MNGLAIGLLSGIVAFVVSGERGSAQAQWAAGKPSKICGLALPENVGVTNPAVNDESGRTVIEVRDVVLGKGVFGVRPHRSGYAGTDAFFCAAGMDRSGQGCGHNGPWNNSNVCPDHEIIGGRLAGIFELHLRDGFAAHTDESGRLHNGAVRGRAEYIRAHYEHVSPELVSGSCFGPLNQGAGRYPHRDSKYGGDECASSADGALILIPEVTQARQVSDGVPDGDKKNAWITFLELVGAFVICAHIQARLLRWRPKRNTKQYQREDKRG